jgi:hypothetical protein
MSRAGGGPGRQSRARLTLTPVRAATLGIVLLMCAWVAATQPFGAPDEAAHYLRALGISNGQLVGPKVPLPHNLGLPAAQYAWAQKDTRGVRASARMTPPGGRCGDGGVPTPPHTCIESTNTGDYHPLPYLLPALAIAASNDADTGLWLARGTSALLCLSFVLLTIMVLSDDRGHPPLGVLLASRRWHCS